uniref:NOT2/NOT3/NOT5 C-terminal domain-containing protein n=1 Tax=Panagrolaimus sp. JU765 TaxID=591449 RepID=A0AC34QZL1_9BILA
MRASSLNNGGGTLVDQLNGVTSQLDKFRFGNSNNPTQQQQQQQSPIGPKTAASIVASGLNKGVPGSPIYTPGPVGQINRNGLYQHQQSIPFGNENDFPILGSRQSPSIFGHLPTTSFGNGQQSLASSISSTANYGSKDASGSMAGLQRMPYANLMRGPFDGSVTNSEFNIQNEDFPALPSANLQQRQMSVSDSLNGEKDEIYKKTVPQRGIHTMSDTVTNIPPGMLGDQFGMAGVLTFLRTLDKSQGLTTLALGHDLTNLGLNLNSPERNLYQSFGGPFSDHSARTQDIECAVPDEYRTSSHIKEKLPPVKLAKLADDTLFFLFYNCPNEAYQMVAANELYQRDWRYHKTLQAWLTRATFTGVKEQTTQYEKGAYHVFDPVQWRKIPKEMTLEYKELEQKPTAPTEFNTAIQQPPPRRKDEPPR